MHFKRLSRTLVALGALFGAVVAQPAKAVIYDVDIGGTMTGIRFGSFGSLPAPVGGYLQSGKLFSASFTLDVTGNVINSVSGTATFDGVSGDITSFGASGGGSLFRGFALRFEELADGSANVGDVSINDLDLRMASSSGQTTEDIFNAALSNSSAITRSSVVAAFRVSTGGTSFHRGQLDSDGVLSTQNVALAATVPIPAGFLLMLSGLVGLGILLRSGNSRRRSTAIT